LFEHIMRDYNYLKKKIVYTLMDMLNLSVLSEKKIGKTNDFIMYYTKKEKKALNVIVKTI